MFDNLQGLKEHFAGHVFDLVKWPEFRLATVVLFPLPAPNRGYCESLARSWDPADPPAAPVGRAERGEPIG